VLDESDHDGRGGGLVVPRIGIEVSNAVAIAAKLANIDVVAAYPITPQTHIVEDLASLVANGELDASYIPVESEHSAMSACLGAAATGARTFTATASQGLALMNEVLFVASSMRFPIVMAVANRALSAPISIWSDHSDAMSVRDTGWIQIFAVSGQEVFDNIICAFRIAEDHRVLLPVMVHLDGFYLSHMIEPIEIAEPAEVDKFLPSPVYPLPLDPAKPVTMGGFGLPNIFTEFKKAHDVALTGAKAVVEQCWQEFGDAFGRYYSPIEGYRCEDARVIMLIMGSFSETLRSAVDSLRGKGEKVGLATLRLWRPFPFAEVRKVVKKAQTLIVVDRALVTGGPGGPVASEVKSALYHLAQKPDVVNFVAGLGGRDISPAGFEEMFHRGVELAGKRNKVEYEMFGVRG
jgi:pyruvate ferredoxin oxidoreductase alpha subunit